MIRCHLSRILGEKKMKIADVMRETGISRGTLTRLYYEKATRIDFDVANKLCEFLEIGIGDLLEYVPDAETDRKTQ